MVDRFVSDRRRMWAFAISLSLVGGALFAAPTAGAAPGQCAPAMPSSQVTKGMDAVGYTVSSGKTPEEFQAEVLGVLPNGIAPGRDMILIEGTSPAIERAGGIWFGMSGSPVYVNGKLIGAVAYGLSGGPSNIAGLTAAQDIVALAERPTAQPREMPRTVRLSGRVAKTVARSSGRTSGDENSMKLLKSPLSISGVGVRGLGVVRDAIDRQKLGLIPYAGTATQATPPQATSAPEPGGNFAAAFSYGDVSSAGIGTTTYVCNGKVVAFGHPFFFFPAGDISLGANSADAITIIDDPLFGPYKLATIDQTYGMVDQDRFAGIRSLLGVSIPTTPITSDIKTDDGLSRREGQTDVVDPGFLGFGTFIHILANADVVRDEISEGTGDLSWTLTGTREDGSPWTFSRSNMFSNEFDITIEAALEPLDNIVQLLFNDFEEVEITGVDVTGSFGTEPKHYEITNLLVDSGRGFKEKDNVKAFPGQVLGLRVVLTPSDGGPDVEIDYEIAVPSGASGDHFVQIAGGPPSGGGGFGEFASTCFAGSLCRQKAGKKVSSFDDLLAKLEGVPHNNELVTVMRGFRGKKKFQDALELDRVIRGEAFLYIQMKGVCCGGGSGPSEPKPSEPKPLP